VNGLHHSFTKANGSDENLINGNGNVTDSVDVFESRAQQSEAINDPRYNRDPAYRARVMAKVGRSNV
jgi:hypothetical protein